MRCLVNLEAVQDQVYNPAYHIKLQGLLYELLSDAGYEFLHRELPFKFVTFSNVFPPKDMSKGDDRTWIIASPNEDLIEALATTIDQRQYLKSGERRYRIKSTTVFEITPDKTGVMHTGTPIVVRIPASRCSRYGIENEQEYDDIYWRLEHPKEAFIQEIERNLAEKYRIYYDEEPPDRPYFTSLEPRKEVATPLHYSDQAVQIIGTTWELAFECLTRPMYRLIKLVYGAGIGELNTTGFGFMNEKS